MTLEHVVSKKSVGYKLSTVFLGEKTQKYGIGRVWSFEPDILDRVKTKYGIKNEEIKKAKAMMLIDYAEPEKLDVTL